MRLLFFFTVITMAVFDVKTSVFVSIGLIALFGVLKMTQFVDKAKNFVSEKIANAKKPEATVDDVDFVKASREGVQCLAKVTVSNPYAVPIPICEISYSLKSAGR